MTITTADLDAKRAAWHMAENDWLRLCQEPRIGMTTYLSIQAAQDEYQRLRGEYYLAFTAYQQQAMNSK